MSMPSAIGVDIGGTKICGVVLVEENIQAAAERKYARKPPEDQEFLAVLFAVIDTLQKTTDRIDLAGIGLAVPGVHSNGRVIYASENLGVLNRIDVASTVSQRYALPVAMDNDVKVAALGEWKLGAGRDSRSMVMLTLGTGLGGAHIKDAQIQRGAFDSAYEMGFLIVDAERSRRGERGDLEWFASEKFFLDRGTDPQEARQKAEQGDPVAETLWHAYGEYLGIGLASIMNVLEPDTIVIGGGIAQAWQLFAPSMHEIIKRLAVSPLARDKTAIVPAALGANAGAIGAALLAMHNAK